MSRLSRSAAARRLKPAAPRGSLALPEFVQRKIFAPEYGVQLRGCLPAPGSRLPRAWRLVACDDARRQPGTSGWQYVRMRRRMRREHPLPARLQELGADVWDAQEPSNALAAPSDRISSAPLAGSGQRRRAGPSEAAEEGVLNAERCFGDGPAPSSCCVLAVRVFGRPFTQQLCPLSCRMSVSPPRCATSRSVSGLSAPTRRKSTGSTVCHAARTQPLQRAASSYLTRLPRLRSAGKCAA